MVEDKEIKLYHWTKKENLKSILKNGLKVNEIGYIYLTKFPKLWEELHKDGILLEVIVNHYKIKLTVFDEEPNGEQILCWSDIQFNKIKEVSKKFIKF